MRIIELFYPPKPPTPAQARKVSRLTPDDLEKSEHMKDFHEKRKQRGGAWGRKRR